MRERGGGPRLSSRVLKMFSRQIGGKIVGGIFARAKCIVNEPHISVFHPIFFLSILFLFSPHIQIDLNSCFC